MSTRDLALFINRTVYDELPAEVVRKVKDAIRDHVGVMLAAQNDRAVTAVRKMALDMAGRPESTIMGIATKVPCNLAAMVNTVMARTLDMDDGAYRVTGHMAHAGGVVIPSALAVAEARNAPGKSLIAAVAAGYEVDLRAGWLISLWKMFVPAGMAGTYGSAAVAAKLLGFNADQTRNALGIAEAHCLYPSRAKTFEKTAMTKEAEAWGAMTGVSAALLANSGFEGPDTIFDLPESVEPLATLRSVWEMMRLYFKPYSSCRFTHAPIDGLFALMRQNNLAAQDIAIITVGVAVHAATMKNYRPTNIWQAQFSIPFTLGAVLAYGEVGPQQVSEASLSDSAILAQADKVLLKADMEVDALRPGMVPARVSITTKDDRVFETWVAYPKGSPENPLSESELRSKYMMLAEPVLGISGSAALEESINHLEECDNVADLISLISPNLT